MLNILFYGVFSVFYFRNTYWFPFHMKTISYIYIFSSIRKSIAIPKYFVDDVMVRVHDEQFRRRDKKELLPIECYGITGIGCCYGYCYGGTKAD